MADINRREFMAAAAVATAACAMCAGHEAEAQTTAPAAGATTVDVGAKTDYAADGMSDKFETTNHIIVTRLSGQIFASSSKCTHQGVDVKITGIQLICPKHHSIFQEDGSKAPAPSGPAKTALPRFAISVDANGHLIVDMSQQFPQAKWTDPASFVTV
jgi:nitrite reductase/ring-hydroxylating ferredoxin subunit